MITAQEALERLQAGNRRFAAGTLRLAEAAGDGVGSPGTELEFAL